jgi:hypothetical protein
MKALVIGAGGVGRAIANIASRRSFIESMVIADRTLSRAEEAVARVKDPRFSAAMVNAAELEDVRELIRKADPDVVINEESPNIFNLMEPTTDLCVVHNINRDRVSTPYFEKISVTISKLHNSIDIFQRKINNFSENTYLENYFNMGVFLYRPKSLFPIIQEMKEMIFNDEELMKYLSFKECGDWFPSQNFTSAYLTHSNLNIKFLSKEWNWLAPDIHTECDEEYFWGKMKPNIYHFTGTDLSKERLKTYTNWKKNG